MSLFRRRPTEDGHGLAALTDEELRRRYRDIDAAVAADGDPQARAAELDQLAEEVLRRDPADAAFWYDRGMYAKWRSDWRACVEYNETALALLPPDGLEGEPAAWNLAIAATALGEWARARRAWSAFGVPLPPTDQPDTPVDADFGLAPVRLNPEPRFVGQQHVVVDGRSWATEVVWGQRLCPARVRIVNVPSPESGHRFGDVVLHDGDTLGTRRLGEHEVGVFNEIGLWQRCPTPTLTVALHAPDQAALKELSELFTGAGGAAEDWGSTLRMLCKACSEGSPGAHHDHDAASTWSPGRQVGVSAEPEAAGALLQKWAEAGPGRSVEDLEVALR